MGLHDLVETVDPSHRDGGLPLGGGVEEVLECPRGEVRRFAGIGSQPDAVG
jgi:hypothetical protein